MAIIAIVEFYGSETPPALFPTVIKNHRVSTFSTVFVMRNDTEEKGRGHVLVF